MIRSLKVKIFGLLVKNIPYFYALFLLIVYKKVSFIDKNRKTILMLTPERFRGDVSVLVRTNEFNIIIIEQKWLQLTFSIFYNQDKLKGDYNFYTAKSGDIVQNRSVFRKTLKREVLLFSRMVAVDAIVSAASYYKWEHDIGYIFEKYVCPWIVFHRENLYASPGFYKFGLGLYGSKGNFYGSHIITHNETTKDIMLSCGYTSTGQVSALGALRMDEFVSKIKLQDQTTYGNQTKKKNILLISFTPGSSLYGYKGDPKNLKVSDVLWPAKDDGMWNLFNHVHRDLMTFCKNNNCNLTIRPKWGDRWLDEIAQMSNDEDAEKTTNVDLISDMHELMFRADVIVGFASTAVLEAGLTNKPVILPYFDEAKYEKYSQYILLKDTFDAFEVADSRIDLTNMLKQYTRSPFILSNDKKNKREKCFEKWVSKTDMCTTSRYIDLINNVIDSYHD
jgi:hypothetical protein